MTNDDPHPGMATMAEIEAWEKRNPPPARVEAEADAPTPAPLAGDETNDPKHEALLVPCPHCGEAPGDGCKTREGHEIGAVHTSRAEAARRLIGAMPALLSACERIVSLAACCLRCDGAGVDPACSGDACDVCGGVGEVAMIGPELTTIRAAVAKAKPTP